MSAKLYFSDFVLFHNPFSAPISPIALKNKKYISTNHTKQVFFFFSFHFNIKDLIFVLDFPVSLFLSLPAQKYCILMNFLIRAPPLHKIAALIPIGKEDHGMNAFILLADCVCYQHSNSVC